MDKAVSWLCTQGPVCSPGLTGSPGLIPGSHVLESRDSGRPARCEGLMNWGSGSQSSQTRLNSVNMFRWPLYCTRMKFIKDVSHLLKKFFQKSPQCRKGVQKGKLFIVENHVFQCVNIQACLHEKPQRGSQLLAHMCIILVNVTATDAALYPCVIWWLKYHELRCRR